MTYVDRGLVFLIDDEVDVLERRLAASGACTEVNNFIKHDVSDRGVREVQFAGAYRWK